jgi:hypothetical protein
MWLLDWIALRWLPSLLVDIVVSWMSVTWRPTSTKLSRCERVDDSFQLFFRSDANNFSDDAKDRDLNNVAISIPIHRNAGSYDQHPEGLQDRNHRSLCVVLTSYVTTSRNYLNWRHSQPEDFPM